MRPRISIPQIWARIAWDRQNRFRVFPGNGRLSGGVESRHAVNSSSEIPEKTEGIVFAEEDPRSSLSGPNELPEQGVITTAHRIRKAVSAIEDSGSSAPPAQPSSEQADFFALLKNPRFDLMHERSGEIQ